MNVQAPTMKPTTRSTLAASLFACVLAGCVTREVVIVQQPAPTQMQVQASMQVQINCREFCRPSHDSCRVGCEPQAWSPNMRDIQSHCESRCDFNQFSCVSNCEHSQRPRYAR
ncbi:MAG: hypothetical protein JNK05_01215 [Myxococcales bacterium]|nr:hypothetical protein [Myxococcales bacterium]